MLAKKERATEQNGGPQVMTPWGFLDIFYHKSRHKTEEYTTAEHYKDVGKNNVKSDTVPAKT